MMLGEVGRPEQLTTAKVLRAVFPAAHASPSVEPHQNRQVLVIPQGLEPRWIIVGSPNRALPVLRSWNPWNRGSRFRWSVVKFAAQTKLLASIPGVQKSAEQIDPSYWVNGFANIPTDLNAVIHVGTSSHTRKAILFLIGKDREVRFGAKIPLAIGAAKAILNEAEVLERFKQFAYLPRVLFKDPNLGIAAQSWLEGSPVSRDFTTAHLELLSNLANSGLTVRVSDFREEVATDLDSVDLPFDRTILARGLELLEFDIPLQSFVEHRDFVPWNLKWLPGGGLGLLDWEWAVMSSVPWQDVCRYFYSEDVHFSGPGKVWQTLNSHPLLAKYRQQFEIPHSALAPLTMRYLLRVLHMDWISGSTWLAEYTFQQIQSLLAACPEKVVTGL
jgi:hypothetical protein